MLPLGCLLCYGSRNMTSLTRHICPSGDRQNVRDGYRFDLWVVTCQPVTLPSSPFVPVRLLGGSQGLEWPPPIYVGSSYRVTWTTKDRHLQAYADLLLHVCPFRWAPHEPKAASVQTAMIGPSGVPDYQTKHWGTLHVFGQGRKEVGDGGGGLLVLPNRLPPAVGRAIIICGVRMFTRWSARWPRSWHNVTVITRASGVCIILLATGPRLKHRRVKSGRACV